MFNGSSGIIIVVYWYLLYNNNEISVIIKSLLFCFKLYILSQSIYMITKLNRFLFYFKRLTHALGIVWQYIFFFLNLDFSMHSSHYPAKSCLNLSSPYLLNWLGSNNFRLYFYLAKKEMAYIFITALLRINPILVVKLLK